MFALGYSVEETTPRRAHSEWALRMLSRLRRATGSDDPFDLAEEAAKRMLGEWVRTFPQAG